MGEIIVVFYIFSHLSPYKYDMFSDTPNGISNFILFFKDFFLTNIMFFDRMPEKGNKTVPADKCECRHCKILTPPAVAD